MSAITSKSNWFLIVIVIALSFVVGWGAKANEQKSTLVWEYKSVWQTHSSKPLDWDALGAEGWELVAVTSHGNIGEPTTYFAYFFKRKK